jgi:hypothetical protein
VNKNSKGNNNIVDINSKCKIEQYLRIIVQKCDTVVVKEKCNVIPNVITSNHVETTIYIISKTLSMIAIVFYFTTTSPIQCTNQVGVYLPQTLTYIIVNGREYLLVLHSAVKANVGTKQQAKATFQ